MKRPTSLKSQTYPEVMEVNTAGISGKVKRLTRGDLNETPAEGTSGSPKGQPIWKQMAEHSGVSRSHSSSDKAMKDRTIN